MTTTTDTNLATLHPAIDELPALPGFLTQIEPASGQKLAHALLYHHAEQILTDAADRVAPDELAALPDHPKFKNAVHASALEDTVTLGGVLEDAQHYLTVLVAQDPDIWIGGEHETAGEHIRAALAEVADKSGGLAYDLATIADKAVPVLAAAGQQAVIANLYRSDKAQGIHTRSKTRYMANAINYLADKLPPAAWEQKVVEIAQDVVDPSVTEDAFKGKWTGKTKAAIDPLEIHEWVEPAGGVLVVPYRSAAQRKLIELSLANASQWVIEDKPIAAILSKIVSSLKKK